MNNETVELGKAEDYTNADSEAYTSGGTDSQNIAWVGKNSSGWKLLLTNVILNVPSGAIYGVFADLLVLELAGKFYGIFTAIFALAALNRAVFGKSYLQKPKISGKAAYKLIDPELCGELYSAFTSIAPKSYSIEIYRLLVDDNKTDEVVMSVDIKSKTAYLLIREEVYNSYLQYPAETSLKLKKSIYNAYSKFKTSAIFSVTFIDGALEMFASDGIDRKREKNAKMSRNGAALGGLFGGVGGAAIGGAAGSSKSFVEAIFMLVWLLVALVSIFYAFIILLIIGPFQLAQNTRIKETLAETLVKPHTKDLGREELKSLENRSSKLAMSISENENEYQTSYGWKELEILKA